MSEPLIGEIKIFSGNFAPQGWAFCNGQILQISQHQALFSILGTIYGGDGRTTFALPNLQGRIAVHTGTGDGLTFRRQGQPGGEERTVLTTTQLPSHKHTLTQVSDAPATQRSTLGSTLAQHRGDNAYKSNNITGAAHVDTITDAPGGGQPHNNMQPSLALNYIIALTGIYPSRN